MRFDKITPKESWPKEKTQSRIDAVMADIANFNKQMNKIDSQMNDLVNQKGIIRRRIGYKYKYLNQLQKQLKETDVY